MARIGFSDDPEKLKKILGVNRPTDVAAPVEPTAPTPASSRSVPRTTTVVSQAGGPEAIRTTDKPISAAAEERVNKQISKLEQLVDRRPDFGRSFDTAVNGLKRERQTLEREVADRESRERWINALGKMAAGIVGLASLQDRQSRGIDVSGLQLDRTDFKSEYDRIFRNYLADKDAIKEQLAQRERGIAAKEAGISQLAGLELRRAIATADRASKEELAGIGNAIKMHKLAAKTGEDADKAKRDAVQFMRKLTTNKQFLEDMNDDEVAAVLGAQAEAAGLSKEQTAKLKDEAFGGWFGDDSPAEAVSRYLTAIQEAGSRAAVSAPTGPAPDAEGKIAVISPDGQTGKIPADQLDEALKEGFRLP